MTFQYRLQVWIGISPKAMLRAPMLFQFGAQKNITARGKAMNGKELHSWKKERHFAWIPGIHSLWYMGVEQSFAQESTPFVKGGRRKSENVNS